MQTESVEAKAKHEEKKSELAAAVPGVQLHTERGELQVLQSDVDDQDQSSHHDEILPYFLGNLTLDERLYT